MYYILQGSSRDPESSLYLCEDRECILCVYSADPEIEEQRFHSMLRSVNVYGPEYFTACLIAKGETYEDLEYDLLMRVLRGKVRHIVL